MEAVFVREDTEVQYMVLYIMQDTIRTGKNTIFFYFLCSLTIILRDRFSLRNSIQALCPSVYICAQCTVHTVSIVHTVNQNGGQEDIIHFFIFEYFKNDAKK